jgi:hypothetical protein
MTLRFFSTLNVVVLAPKVHHGHHAVDAAIGHLVRHQLAGVLEREGLHVHDARRQAGSGDRAAALLDILGTGGHQQHVVRLGVLLRGAQHFEVVGDLLHGEGDVLVGLHLDLGFQIGVLEVARHLDDLGDRGIAADRHGHLARAGAGAAHRARNRLTDRIGIDDRLLVHGVLGGGFGRVGIDGVLAARQAQFDELDRRRSNIETKNRAVLAQS